VPANGSDGIPQQADILSSLKQGACVVTDGPLLEFSVRQGDQVAHVGQILALNGDGEAQMQIVAHSTPEFGAVAEVEVVTYLQGQPKKKPITTSVGAGEEKLLELEGRRGYCRLQAWTTGRDGERFCCFTNPLWLRLGGDEKKKLRVQVQARGG
jgi:hypothetical protein